jgi:uncharacterized protein (DUF58 family)
MREVYQDDYVAGEIAGQRFAFLPPRQAPYGSQGGVLSSRAGSSMDFRDFREYQPGDDLRHLDWNAFARSDQLVLRVYREEVLPHVEVIVDATKSMNLPDSKKAAAVRGITSFFAVAALNSGFASQAWEIGSEVQPLSSTNTLPGNWRDLQFDSVGDPTRALIQNSHRFRSRGIRVFISDLLWMGDPRATLHPLANQASQLIVIHLLADADINPPLGGSFRLMDVETEQTREIYLDAAIVRKYRQNLERHQTNWDQACRQLGAVYLPVIAEKVLENWDWSELVARQILEVA